MCGCDISTLSPCPTHTEEILAGLAEVRDLDDRGDPDGASRVMDRLHSLHGDGMVRVVVEKARAGDLDLRLYGKPYPRGH
ncbi:hypothetical protein ABT336_11980 [Micromonospora sp. NPDC000207]|uniref:hypothetical protein n=1 Tax=Micromonospora sp. NPDC000207 TaxID=3154246 RepID=UPI003333160E